MVFGVLAAFFALAVAAAVFRRRRLRTSRAIPGSEPAGEAPVVMGLHVLWVGLRPPGAVTADTGTLPGCTAEYVATGAHAIDALIRQRPDLVLIDLDLSDIPASRLMREIWRMQSDALESPSVILSVERRGGRRSAIDADAENSFDESIDDANATAAVTRWLTLLTRQRGPEAIGIRFDPAVAESMPGYIESRVELALLVERMLREGNRPGAARAAHKLAGSPGILGFEKGIFFYRGIAESVDDEKAPIDQVILADAHALANEFSALHRR